MGFREAMQGNQTAMGVIAAIVLIIAVALITRSGASAPGSATSRWFYDLQTGELYVESTQGLPPLAREGASEGVLAHVYGCGDCSQDNIDIAYLEKYSEEAKAAAAAAGDSVAARPNASLLALVPAVGEEPQWQNSEGEAAQQIVLSVVQLRRQCQGGFLPCRP
jgi:hypothetical protein